MAALQPVRGTHDLLPEDHRRHRHVIDNAAGVSSLYGYEFMSTPIFEFTQVFKRTLGDTSDVVTKEMYTFTDKGGDEITLRPENTAGVCRAFMSNGLAQHAPVRYFYGGPMFRYERPQKGRLRQFHQIGIELIGAPQPQADIEVIACGAAILDRLGILGRTELELNTLGDTASRTEYRNALVEYFSDHKDSLSEDSRDRLNRNPLRILDSKDEGDRKLIVDAPVFSDYLNQESQEFFATVRQGLDDIGIGYRLNPRLVRGLDYYCHTAFEFTTTELGSQSAVMAGGRYDGLMEMMGGQPTPGVGWAAGIERLSMLATEPEGGARPVALVPMGEAAERQMLKLAETLRHAGVQVDMAFGGNMKKRMKRADKVNASQAVILGDDELARGVVQIKDLATGEQIEAPMDGLAARLAPPM
ncbi:histidine--tRNA ligase [Hwanghaeella grinnelliae]|uniref:Histidine--tRNA ligase n=1 Tax=Hwanghaeella grinnelliae TaxID=2500179 RepID=A0A437QMY1_9PROT|nr:histidine--tRNA ligase [Hwanghaeella grinnelliae]RVU35857.1 histidine--tRNA ligase [Hwanghaeella grinnelliae]